jgi:DNA mismatch repair protein MutL
LGHALQDSYRGLLMSGRYPVAMLFLDVPPDQVDVNVHPTKSEVRFRDSQAMYHLVFGALRERLRAENLTARLQRPAFSISPATLSAPINTFPEFTRKPSPTFPPASPAETLSPEARADGQNAPPLGSTDFEAPATPKAIQLHDAYLVLETPDGMLVIDQHALHERILYEQLKSRMEAGAVERQRLLIPEPIDLLPEQAARALEHRESLAELGLEIDDFGGGTILLTAYPAILDKREPRAILLAVMDYLTSKERPPNREQLLNDLLSLMACHAAVKAGDRLTPEEISFLVAQREMADNTHHCPHGRPTSLLFSKRDLDRQFRRT